MLHNLDYAQKKLHCAVRILAGKGSLEFRICAAAGLLIHIEENDLPDIQKAELNRLKASLFDSSAQSRVVFTARELSDEALEIAATRFVELYSSLAEANFKIRA